jgi:hypothetical protein
MRINNWHVSTLVVGPSGETYRKELPRPDTADQAGLDFSFHTPSLELTQWISLLSEEPEIRAEVVARVTHLLVSGYYLSPESATQTAEAILAASE